MVKRILGSPKARLINFIRCKVLYLPIMTLNSIWRLYNVQRTERLAQINLCSTTVSSNVNYFPMLLENLNN